MLGITGAVFFLPIIIAVIAALAGKNNKNFRDRNAVDRQVDGMTQEDMRKAVFGAQQAANAKKTSTKKFEEDILTRSVSNANEDFSDDVIKDSSDKHEYCSAPHFEETEDFNKTVQDLIVFGPNCKMSYERDFIAEGEKMLNMQKG